MDKLKPEEVEEIIQEFKKRGVDAKVVACPWFNLVE